MKTKTIVFKNNLSKNVNHKKAALANIVGVIPSITNAK